MTFVFFVRLATTLLKLCVVWTASFERWKQLLFKEEWSRHWWTYHLKSWTDAWHKMERIGLKWGQSYKSAEQFVLVWRRFYLTKYWHLVAEIKYHKKKIQWLYEKGFLSFTVCNHPCCLWCFLGKVVYVMLNVFQV